MTIGEVTLTREQQVCVDYRGRDCLVRGVAGSGKSYVLIRRAVKLNKDSGGKESVYVFMYNKSLQHYTEELLRDGKVGQGIVVATVDKYCVGIYNELRKNSYQFKTPKKGEREKMIESSLRTIERQEPFRKRNHRFYSLPMTFWEDEFKWIKEKNILTKDEYLSSNRKGRGGQVRMTEADKELSWRFYTEYKKRMERARKNDWEDIYIYLLKNIDKIPDKYYIDHILIDEAQDFSLAKMKVMRSLSVKSFTVAADIAQKIYKTTFSWKEVGVEILGSASKKLSKSFRSTEQIVLLAEDLLTKNRRQGDEEEYTRPIIPDVQGPEPLIVDCDGKDDEIVLTMVRLFRRKYPEDTIAVVYRTNYEVDKSASMFASQRIPFQILKKEEDEKRSILRPGLKLVTAHSSKGLEFDCVIICRLNEGNYPMTFEMRQSDNMEEALSLDRSLLYVAMTRARHILMMTYDRLKRSRFIDEFNPDHYKKVRFPEDNELLQETIDKSQKGENLISGSPASLRARNMQSRKVNTVQQKEVDEKRPDDKVKIQIGAKVFNKKWGIGSIVKMKDGKITVRYERGEKMYIYDSAFKAGTLRLC